MTKKNFATQDLVHLFAHVKKAIDLGEFLETQTGCRVTWSTDHTKASMICPMPFHSDSVASFHVEQNEDGIWLFHCFGCGSTGTIIDFFKDYYGLKTNMEALIMILDVFKLENTEHLAMESLTDTRKKTNVKKNLECAHIVSANQCRMLLRMDYKKFSKWVALTYKKMNKALEEDDIDTIERIGFEVSEKMMEA